MCFYIMAVIRNILTNFVFSRYILLLLILINITEIYSKQVMEKRKMLQAEFIEGRKKGNAEVRQISS